MPPLIKFTEEQDNFIRENCNKMIFNEIAKHLGISATAARKRAITIGIHQCSSNTKITLYQQEYIKEHYGNITTTKLSKFLNLSRKTVLLNARLLGLVKPELEVTINNNFDNGKGFFCVEKFRATINY